MTSTDAANEPNSKGFGGAATGPEPAAHEPRERRHEDAEDTAVPGDDLTQAAGDAASGSPTGR